MKHAPIVHFQRLGRPAETQLDPVLVERARAELAFTALRRRKLPGRRVGDIDWLTLLELFVAHAEDRALMSKEVAEGAAPLSTRLRYLDQLERAGMIVRSESQTDGRATLIRATPKGLARIASILGDASIGDRPLPAPHVAARHRQ